MLQLINFSPWKHILYQLAKDERILVLAASDGLELGCSFKNFFER
jgi:hypothetical protein